MQRTPPTPVGYQVFLQGDDLYQDPNSIHEKTKQFSTRLSETIVGCEVKPRMVQLPGDFELDCLSLPVPGLEDLFVRPTYHLTGYVRFKIADPGITDLGVGGNDFRYASLNDADVRIVDFPIAQIVDSLPSSLGAVNPAYAPAVTPTYGGSIAFPFERYHRHINNNRGVNFDSILHLAQRLSVVGGNKHEDNKIIRSREDGGGPGGICPLPTRISEICQVGDLVRYFFSDNTMSYTPGYMPHLGYDPGSSGSVHDGHSHLERFLKRIENNLNEILNYNKSSNSHTHEFVAKPPVAWSKLLEILQDNDAGISQRGFLPIQNNITLTSQDLDHQGKVVAYFRYRTPTDQSLPDPPAGPGALSYLWIDQIQLNVEMCLSALRYEDRTDQDENMLGAPTVDTRGWYYAFNEAGLLALLTKEDAEEWLGDLNFPGYVKRSQIETHKNMVESVTAGLGKAEKQVYHQARPTNNPNRRFYFWFPLPIRKICDDYLTKNPNVPNPLNKINRYLMDDMTKRYGVSLLNLQDQYLFTRRPLRLTSLGSDWNPDRSTILLNESGEGYLSLAFNDFDDFKYQARDFVVASFELLNIDTYDEMRLQGTYSPVYLTSNGTMQTTPLGDGSGFLPGLVGSFGSKIKVYQGMVSLKNTHTRLIKFHCPELALAQTVKQYFTNSSIAQTPYLVGDYNNPSNPSQQNLIPYEKDLRDNEGSELFSFFLLGNGSDIYLSNNSLLQNNYITKQFPDDQTTWIQLLSTRFQTLHWWLTDELGRKLIFPKEKPIVQLAIKSPQYKQ